MSKKISPINEGSRDPYVRLGAVKLKEIHSLMVKARVLEERLIKMSKGGDGFFWIGGPGEEGFNVPLGLQVKKGSGLDFDFMHFHYRSSAVIMALGGKIIDTIRQMRTSVTDPYSRGRNFVNHYSIPEWNVMPISPTIETQYSTCIGTAIAQARHGGDSITIVNGGDAGTAEGDFHSCLVWANRPALPLPILMIVTNNGYGISTPAREQHGEKNIADWAKTFPEMPGKTINGNDPIESYFAILEALNYVRENRKPCLLESRASRLYGHSSSSGANRMNETDCIQVIEAKMIELGYMNEKQKEEVWKTHLKDCDEALDEVRKEPFPDADDIWKYVFSSELPDSYPKKGGS